MQKRNLWATVGRFLLALTLGALAGYIDMIEEDVQLPALMLLLSAFLLGSLSPRRPWLWALLIGLCIPVAHAIGFAIHYQPPYPAPWAPTLILPVVIAFAGAYAGALVRWAASQLRGLGSGA